MGLAGFVVPIVIGHHVPALSVDIVGAFTCNFNLRGYAAFYFKGTTVVAFERILWAGVWIGEGRVKGKYMYVGAKRVLRVRQVLTSPAGPLHVILAQLADMIKKNI
jgi:hypothetical protein